MQWGGPVFVLAIIAMSYGAWMVTSWIRAKHGYPLENEWSGGVIKADPDANRKIALLSSENDKLHGQIGRLEERITVLERIVTDEAHNLTREIEDLRRTPAN